MGRRKEELNREGLEALTGEASWGGQMLKSFAALAPELGMDIDLDLDLGLE